MEGALKFRKDGIELSQVLELLPFVVDTGGTLFLFGHFELEGEAAIVEALAQELGKARFDVRHHLSDLFILQDKGYGTCLLVYQGWLHNAHSLSDGRLGLRHRVDEGLPLDKQLVAVDGAVFFGERGWLSAFCRR